MLLDFIIENKKEIQEIFCKYNATNIVIIGSVSKRKETKESDIDFVIQIDEYDAQKKLQDYIDLKNDLEEYFSRRIDLAFYEQIRDQYPRALNEGFVLSGN